MCVCLREGSFLLGGGFVFCVLDLSLLLLFQCVFVLCVWFFIFCLFVCLFFGGISFWGVGGGGRSGVREESRGQSVCFCR